MIFEQHYKVGNRDIGNNNKATNKAMLKYLENIACMHSDEVGYGINTIAETKVVWILLDWKYKVIERPKYGQNIKVRTWSRKMEKYYAYRDFEICDEKENVIAIATTKWVLLGADTKKLQRIPEELVSKYEQETQRHVFENEIEKLHEIENYQYSIEVKTRRTDLDINNHVNNLNYLDLAYEILPDEIYNKELNNVRITYKHQTEPKETVNIAYARQNDKNIITIKTQNQEQLHAIIELW
jgi:medium-chain acyl-[acyl-carrier-protein] hydrolase